jgi:uncharacterized membrane protein YdcZ (DUF606 family)
MAVPEKQAERVDPAQSGPAYLSSAVALSFGVVLAVGVSLLFGLLGWGGELASQTAGAASGAAPLIIDGIRQRQAQRSRPPSWRALTRGLLYRPKLLIASALGFALLLLDSAASLLAFRLSSWTIRLAHGDPGRWSQVFTLLGGLISLPIVLIGTYLLALVAGHRLGERSRRWILLGMGIYGVMRIATVLASAPSPGLDLMPISVIVGSIITALLLVGVALLGARRARKTQAAYYAKVYFNRLPPSDQEAALALLDETVTATKP